MLLLGALAGCGGSDGGEGGVPPGGCAGSCALATPTALTVPEVERIVSQAVQEAQTRGALATIAVVDRSGNVLAVFQMTGALPTFTVTSGRGVTGGLEGAVVPSEFGAISKAITGAYLSSEGNAFSTRTANQIVQENFNPGIEIGSPGGPLFGVQFSSLACSDIVLTAAAGAGPRGSPLGLAADPGGLPLYKNGTVVGGIGVIADGIYGLDLDISNIDTDVDELVAVAGASGFDAPAGRRANVIAVDGRTLRYVDSEVLASNPAAAPAFATLPGTLVTVAGYKAVAAVSAGVAYGTTASGIRADNNPAFAGLNAFVLDNGVGVNRYPPIAGTDGLLTQPEVTRILAEAITIANRARAQIRRPLGSPAQVSIAVVDTTGTVLGFIRTPDAPVFGIDVSVQKARSALLFSHPNAAAEINAAGFGSYVTGMQAFIPGGSALADGVAYSNRSVGNLARPFFPDGINSSSAAGPLSRPFASWSPFTDGLQLDLALNGIVGNIGVNPAPPCTGLTRAPNGIQIFPGSVPIFRGGVLAGAIGISGDGIDQDDMVAFLGLANAGNALGNIAHAPAAQRADQVGGLPGGQLRYVNCPVAPFLDTTATNICDGI